MLEMTMSMSMTLTMTMLSIGAAIGWPRHCDIVARPPDLQRRIGVGRSVGPILELREISRYREY